MGKLDRVKKRTRKCKRKFQGNQYTLENCARRAATVASADKSLETPAPADVGTDTANVEDDVVTTEPSILEPLPSTPEKTVSQKKIQDIATDTPKQSDSKITGNRIIDVEILSDIFHELNCPSCNAGKLRLHEKLNEKKGLASLLVLNCSNDQCDYEKDFYTSKHCRGKFFDVNTRIVYAMRSIGQGYASIEKFNALMNLPKPMVATSYKKNSIFSC